MNDQYRILTPSEYEGLMECIPKTRSRIVIDALLNTGMRYSELDEFSHHLVWFDIKNRCITLPAHSTKTEKARVVHLTPAFTKRLSAYLWEFKTLELPPRQMMNLNLKRWWDTNNNPDARGDYRQGQPNSWCPSVKTFRKTWESWLLFAGYDSLKVALNMGHTQTIQLNHYANMSACLKSEVEAVKRMTEGWMI